MEEVVGIIARALVEYPEEVRVHSREEEHFLVLELHVAPSDVGRVIGRQGKIARAIRTLVRAAGAYQRRRVSLEIV